MNRQRNSRVALLAILMLVSCVGWAAGPTPSWLTPPVEVAGEHVNQADFKLSDDGSRATAIWNLGSSVIQARSATIDGNVVTWGPITDFPEGTDPQIALSSDGTQAIAVWIAGRPKSQIQIRSATINGNEASWGPVQSLTDGEQCCVRQPKIAISSDGTMSTAVWIEGPGSYWGMLKSSSAILNGTSFAWSKAKILNPDTNMYPQLSLSRDGEKAMVVWSKGEGILGLQAVITGNQAAWNESYEELGGYSSEPPRLAFSGSGNRAVVVWYHHDSINRKAILRSSIASLSGVSAKWSVPVDISGVDGSIGSSYEIALSQDGERALAIWTWNNYQSNSVLQGRSAKIDGNGAVWSLIADLSDSEQRQARASGPQVALSSDGSKASVIWTESGTSYGLKSRFGLFMDNKETWGDVHKISEYPGLWARSGFSTDGKESMSIWSLDNKLLSSSATIDYDVSQIANLTVNKSGSGNITSNPAGISCGSTCTASFNSGQFVTLTASPDNGFIFSNWTGACAGSANCTVTMNSEKTVGATFTASSSNRTLTVTKSGSGTITSVPATISCGATCSGTFTSGTTVSLFAQPDYGFAFAGWGGPCASTGTCVVTMDGDKSVSANFIELPKYPVKAIKPSTGVISSEPAGILCGGSNRQCSSMFSSAKLSATPNPGYEFIRWNGCQAPEGNICYIKPIGKMTVSAVFKKLPKYKIKISKNTLGSITSTPAGLNCPDKKKSCVVSFIKGTEVTLNAVPQSGRNFVGWSGACSGTDSCSLLMDGNKGIGANFQ